MKRRDSVLQRGKIPSQQHKIGKVVTNGRVRPIMARATQVTMAQAHYGATTIARAQWFKPVDSVPAQLI